MRLGLLVLWVSAFASSYYSATQTVILICAVIFTASRFAFTYAFVTAWQPWRTLAWALAITCVNTAAVVGTVSAWMGQKYR